MSGLADDLEAAGFVIYCGTCDYPTYSPPGVRCTTPQQHDWPPPVPPAGTPADDAR